NHVIVGSFIAPLSALASPPLRLYSAIGSLANMMKCGGITFGWRIVSVNKMRKSLFWLIFGCFLMTVACGDDKDDTTGEGTGEGTGGGTGGRLSGCVGRERVVE
ncbi:MAG: hypothetical protein VB859_12650, partial [Planctomycetaceae bacterium]